MTGTSAPRLTSADIQREIVRLVGPGPRRSKIIAIHGTGEEDTLAVEGATWQVVPTSCEFEMRSRMPLPQQRNERGLVFLVDWTDGSLPLDLNCRLAGGQMIRVASDSRLASLFGARTVDPELHQTPLARVLLAGEVDGLGKVTGQRLTADEAYRRFLKAWLDLPLDDELSTPRVLTWCATQHRGPAFIARGSNDATWASLCEDVRKFVEKCASPLAAACWTAWERDQGLDFLRLCLVLEAVADELTTETVVHAVLRSTLRHIAPEWGPGALAYASDLADLSLLDEVLEQLGCVDGAAATSLPKEAQDLVDEPAIRKALVRSYRLPMGYEDRTARLGEKLVELSADPTSERLSEVLALHAELSDHRLDGDWSDARRRRQMSLRLAAYLVHRVHTPPTTAGGAAYQEALDLAECYAAEGGFVDWARQDVRGSGSGSWADGVAAVLSEVDDLRRDDDRRFAHGAVQWLRADHPAHQLLHVEDVTEKLVGGFLGDDERRKLLVVLADGMGWAGAVELVDSLAREPGRWAPVCWRPAGHRDRPAGRLPAVIASVPTLTSVSRAALFSGKDQPNQGHKGTGNDHKRWANNPTVRKLDAGGDEPQLLIGAKVADKQGLTPEAKRAVSSDARVVALVLNAVDDQLHASQQQARWPCVVDNIKPLHELLEVANSEDRAVLLCSDHGHVPGSLLSHTAGGPDAHARWRPLASGEEPREHEVELPADKVWKPRGAAGIAAIWDDRVTYGQPHFGEHGGVSLAEAVAPAILVAPADLWKQPGGAQDPEQRTVPLEEPPWWRLELPGKRVSIQQDDESDRLSQAQLSLPTMPAPPPTACEKPPAVPELPPLLLALRKAPTFKAVTKGLAQERVDQALDTLAILVDEDGPMAAEDFARACGVQPFQVDSRVARLGEVLNIEGFAVVEHDRRGGQVLLNRDVLEQLYLEES